MSSCVFLLGVVVHSEHFNLILGIVGNNYLHRVDYGTHAVGVLVQVFAYVMLKQVDVVQCLIFGVANVV